MLFMQRRKIYAIVYAVMAAVFYAVNVPLSKLLLDHVGTATMAALLYLGAGIGIGIMSLLSREKAICYLCDSLLGHDDRDDSGGDGHAGQESHP